MVGLLAALVGAACVIGAMPTVGLVWPMAVAFTPLLLVSRRATARRRFLLGWLMGTVCQAVLFRWIIFTLREMSGLHEGIGFVALLLFALWHGLAVGLFFALAEPLRRAVGRDRPGLALLLVATLWTSIEWLWPNLFPWYFGQAFWRVPQLSSVMALTGAPGLSFLAVASSVMAAELISTRRLRPLVPLSAAALALLAFGLWHHARLGSTPPRRVMKVAVLQPAPSLEDKKDGGFTVRGQQLRRLEATLRAMPPDTYDLIVAPEGAFTYYWRVDPALTGQPLPNGPLDFEPPTQKIRAALAAGPRADLLIGALRHLHDGKIHNSAILVGPDGRDLAVYDKRVLVPFGEYLPGTSIFPSLAHAVPGIANFDAGERPCRLRAAGESMACGICYETLFASETREVAGDDAAFLVNMTIDVWFGRSTAPWFHLMSQSSRAAELGVPLVRAALTGISAIVGPDGVPSATLDLDERALLVADLPLRDITTPYRVVGPLFAWICLVLSALGLAFTRRAAAPPAHSPTALGNQS
ncbi:MAG: apolipoprotein N-acyltransferase [Myxococcota bacterium]